MGAADDFLAGSSPIRWLALTDSPIIQSLRVCRIIGRNNLNAGERINREGEFWSISRT
jgi:hypothetical protein